MPVLCLPWPERNLQVVLRLTLMTCRWVPDRRVYPAGGCLTGGCVLRRLTCKVVSRVALVQPGRGRAVVARHHALKQTWPDEEED